MMRYIIGIAVLLFVLYFFGILKKIPIVKDLPFLGEVELTDNCHRKNCDGSYDLSILFERSDNRSFEKQKLEIFYKISIKRQKCSIGGSGYKSGEQTTDTLSQQKLLREYSSEKFPVIVNGEILNDTLYLELSKSTKSNIDHKVNLKFPYSGDEINVSRGAFEEDLTNSKGKAKISKN